MNELLVSKVLKRKQSLFSEDIQTHTQDLEKRIQNASVLIIGAAGSIGSAFVKQIVGYKPKALHLLDISENELVEVVRDLRSSDVSVPDDFKTFAFAFGSLEFSAFLSASYTYDFVVNFSALKHVRSERDPYTLMRLVQTNILAIDDVLTQLKESKTERFFSVSSDKSVNPVSLMGASKGFMERVMWQHSEAISSSSARFANVAFSYGSLLFGFHRRIEKRQPLAAPSDVRRYFISHEEAGQLCLLACFLGHNRDVYFPKLNEQEDMLTFSEIAKLFLEHQGLEPVLFDSDLEAKAFAHALSVNAKQWPCVFSTSDTTGEKMYEEFFSKGDSVDFERYADVAVLNEPQLSTKQVQSVTEALSTLRKLRAAGRWSKEDISNAIKLAVPATQHEEKRKDLDQKM